MEILKRQVKRITSIILIITILVGVLPNFGLLKETKAASEDEAKMIVRPGLEEFEEINGNKIFKLDIYFKNVETNSWSIYLKYNSEKFIPADKTTGEETNNISKCVDISNKAQFGIDTNKNYAENGEIYFTANTGSSTLPSLDYINFSNEQDVCTIFFKVKDINLQISQVSTDDFIINESKDDSDFTSIALSEAQSYLSSSGDGMIYADLDTRYFATKEFKGASLQSLSITANPTEGKKYIHGKEIDLAGVELTATYTDNSTKTINIDDPELKITLGDKENIIADINNKQITFEYKGKTTTLDVNVIDPVKEIEVIDEDKILINGTDSGNDIPTDEEGLYINATTASGNTSKIPLDDTRINLSSYTADINEVPDDKKQNAGGGMQSGFQTITVTYQDEMTEAPVGTTFDILVNDTIASIEISKTNPPTSSFTIGDTFIKDGAITVIGASGITYGDIDMSSDSVKVTELDGTVVDLTNITPRNLLVSFGEATVEYPITVQNKVVSIKVNQDKSVKLKYDKKINEQQIAFAGITVTEIMADGTEGDTKNLDFSWIQNTDCYDTNIYNHTLKINYPYNGTIVEGEILVSTIDEITGIRVENLKTDYVYKDELNYKGAQIYIDYVSGFSTSYEGTEILDLFDCTLTNDGFELQVTGFDSSKIEKNQKITFTYSEEGSQTKTAEVFVNIDKATLEVPECEQLEIVEGIELSTIANELPTTEYGQVEWKDATKTLTYVEGEDNVQEIDATYKMNTTYAPYYNDVDCKIKVKVLKREVSSIEILDTSTNETNYVEGQDFDPTGMQIEVTYNDGGTATITVDENTKGLTYSPDRALTIDDTEITVTYSGKTDKQAITVIEKKVTKIEITTPPTKTSYVEGQALDLTGMVVKATYNDGDVKEITNYTTNPANGATLALTDTEITVTYDGTDAVADIATVSQTITVESKKVTKIEITTPPTKTSYVEGQALDLSGMVVKATYNDGDVKETTNYTANPANGDTLSLGDTTITVTYDGTDAVADIATATTEVTVEAKVVTKIEITTPPTKTSYVEGHPFNPAGMVVTAYYNDGTNAPTTNYTIIPSGNLTPDNTKVTITYNGTDIAEGTSTLTANVEITVTARQVESIEITKDPNRTSFYEGQNFDPTGMEITVNYNDHENPLVIKDDYTSVTFSPSLTDKLKTTDQTVTVAYGGKEATQDITVEEDYVKEITVSYPNNFQQVGKNVDLENTTIQKIWASELSHGADDTEAITIDMISSSAIVDGKFTTPGNIEITVTYDNGKTDKPTAKFNVYVEDAIQSITLTEKQTKTYWVGDDIASNLELAINYSNPANNRTIDSTSPDWSKCSIKGIDMSKPNTYLLTVTYGGLETAGKTITVNDFVKEIRVTNNKSIYRLNENGNFNIEVFKIMASEPEKAKPVIRDEYNLSIANTVVTNIDTTSATTVPTEVEVTYIGTSKKPGDTIKAKFTVQVINGTNGAILVEPTTNNLPEKLGDRLDLTGFKVEVKDQTGTIIKTITLPDASIVASAYNANTLNPQTISFTYKYQELNEIGEMIEKTMPVEGKINITLQDYWTGEIKVSGIPTTSIKGQELNLSSAKVSKVMASGALSETMKVLNNMISGFDKNTERTQTITITNWGKTATVDVTVTDYITGISMNKLPNKVNYTQGESIDVTGAVLNITKQSGRIEEISITKEMIRGYNPNKVGQQTVIVDYYGFTTNFVVNVKAKTPTKPVNPNKPTKPVTPTTPSVQEPIVPEETKKYLVTFVNYDGTILKTEEVESGKAATEPILKARKGYKFVGWDKDFDVVEEDMKVTAQYEKIKTIKESPKPTETLGEKDEIKETNGIKETLVPATIGLAITGFLLLLIAAITRKNVEVYAVYGEEKKLIGREKISKNNNKIELDSYKSKLENAVAVELRISDKVVEKMAGEIVEVTIDSKTKKYKMTDVIIIKK